MDPLRIGGMNSRDEALLFTQEETKIKYFEESLDKCGDIADEMVLFSMRSFFVFLLPPAFL
jgi:hypothetical protein